MSAPGSGPPPPVDPAERARALGVSLEAAQLLAASDCIDLHIESFIWTRLCGYDLRRRHGRGLLGARLYSQVDFPRMAEGGMTGGVFSIATNPFRRRKRRTATCLRNIAALRAIIASCPDTLQLVTDRAGYHRARAAGKIACWLALQGANGLDSAPGDLYRIPDDCVSRVTLVHMTRSSVGRSSAPGGWGGEDLTPAGEELIAQLNHKRVLVDLAHISRQGFARALQVHAPALPPIVSHTGADAVHRSWRNLEDWQIRAIADRGGVVGVIFHCYFLDGSLLGSTADAVVDHLAHVVALVGEDHAALGSDWDGMIVTPRDMPTVLELAVLVQRMLDRGLGPATIQKVLGGNYLRVLGQLRP